jgi:hypothetical protein
MFYEKQYYVRFVVEELKYNKGNLHKATISNVALIETKDYTTDQLPSAKTHGEIGRVVYSDESLAQFLNSVKPLPAHRPGWGMGVGV